MKAIQFIKFAILFCYVTACAGKGRQSSNEDAVFDSSLVKKIVGSDTIVPGKVITRIFCEADPTQSYALYIPEKGNKENLPVVYFFDPHGDGSFPVNKYKELAEAYNFILAGSNNSKNGNDFPTSENIWNILFNDSQKRLKINTNRIYLCGFSGGAKVATYIALHHNEIKGLIANGAGLPDITHAGNFNFSFTAVAGEGDLNMTDLVAIANALEQTQTRHRIIFFDGIHEWAPEKTMNIAFAGLQLDAMHEKVIPADNTFINSYIDSSKKRVNQYYNNTNYIKAEQECLLSNSILDGLTNETNWFQEKDASIKNNTEYKKQWQAKQQLLVKEQNLKDEYEQKFQQANMNYWLATIKDINAKSKMHTAEAAMYQRLKAYLSLAFYSISNQLIKGNQDSEAKNFVDLYKIADPANSEAWYFSALLNARNNDAKATKDDLLKAVSTGFTDKSRLMQQPEFQQLASQLNLSEIERKIK